MKTFDLINQYFSIVDSIYGVYLDSTRGFHLLLTQQLEVQFKSIADLRNTNPELASLEYLDSCAMIYGRGNPNNPDSIELHRCTQGELKSRNERGGKNFLFIANVCIVAIYQYWEDHFREQIALSLGKTKNDIVSSIMGDLRYLRMSIIHNNGFAVGEVERSQILKWFKRGDPVAIDKHQFEEIILEIKKYLVELTKQIEGKADADD